ncbi:MAG: DUF2232 domain-containing protein [Clostridia bacterium]
MNENNFNLVIIIRLFVSLLPLLFGFPLLAFCLCAYNCAMVIITMGPIYGCFMELISAVLAVVMCSSAGYGYAYGGFFALEIVLASGLCAFCGLTKRPFSVGLLLTSAGYGVGQLLSLKYMADEAGMSIAENAVSQFINPMNEAFDTMTVQGGAESAEELNRILELAGSIMKNCVPAFVIIGAIAAGYAVMWQTSKSLRLTPLNNGHSFAQIRIGIPEVIFGAAMLVLLFVPDKRAGVVGINGLLVFLFMAFCAGLSLVDFLMRRKIKGTFARTMIHGAIFIGALLVGAVIPFFNIFVIYALAGIVDCFASFRKKATLHNEVK